MTYDLNRTLPEEFLESIAEQGMDVLPELIQTLVNAAVWLTGQFSGDQVTLVSGDTRVALTNMNSASGTLSLEGEAEVPFTTTLATGDAGLYRAEATFDGRDYTGGWIVLNDGQQRGAIT